MSVSPEKYSYAKPVTLADPKPDLNPLSKPISFVLTNRDRDTVAIVKCDIAAMQRRFRQPEGLEVGTATESEWTESREAFRRTL